jgi:GNAT superfamily N-acetyltransferase
MKIIRATKDNADSLTEIAISAKRHWNYPEAWIQHWLPQLTISAEYISTNEVWMMVDEEKPIAFYSISQTEEGYELGHLWVLPEYIGKRIGKQLLKHAFERCKLLNIDALKIYADPNAKAFYEKMGAKQIDAKQIDEYHSDLFGQDRILPIMEIQIWLKRTVITVTPIPKMNLTNHITIHNMVSQSKMMMNYLNASCWKLIKQACRGF